MTQDQLLAEHQRWLSDPHTQLVLQELGKRRRHLLTVAESKASYGKEDETIPILLKTRAYKEIYDILSSAKTFVAESTK